MENMKRALLVACLEWAVLPFLRIELSLHRAKMSRIDRKLELLKIRFHEADEMAKIAEREVAMLAPLVAKAKADYEAAKRAAPV
jgi:hypothetical protein